MKETFHSTKKPQLFTLLLFFILSAIISFFSYHLMLELTPFYNAKGTILFAICFGITIIIVISLSEILMEKNIYLTIDTEKKILYLTDKKGDIHIHPIHECLMEKDLQQTFSQKLFRTYSIFITTDDDMVYMIANMDKEQVLHLSGFF